MINISDRFEDIIGKIIDASPVSELIEMQISGCTEIYVFSIYLEDHDEALDYTFDWILNKPFRLQSQKTQSTLKIILNNE